MQDMDMTLFFWGWEENVTFGSWKDLGVYVYLRKV